MQLNIPNVQRIEIERIYPLYPGHSYSRVILVHSKEGRHRLVLFADDPESLNLVDATEE